METKQLYRHIENTRSNIENLHLFYGAIFKDKKGNSPISLASLEVLDKSVNTFLIKKGLMLDTAYFALRGSIYIDAEYNYIFENTTYELKGKIKNNALYRIVVYGEIDIRKAHGYFFKALRINSKK